MPTISPFPGNKKVIQVIKLSVSEYKVARFYPSNCYITSGKSYIIPTCRKMYSLSS
jgi:hypothetical protein